MNSKAIKCTGDNGVCVPISTYSVQTEAKVTNADKIRSMSDEELADYIFGVSVSSAPCVKCNDDCDFCELSDEECKKKTLN